MPKPSLLGHTPDRLAGELESWSLPGFRIRQLYRALHRQRVVELEAITALDRPLRRRLDDAFSIARPGVVGTSDSGDATTKLLFALADGATVEAVDIPEPGRRTLCVSSQAGCALGCRFCVTGFWGAGRDLDAGEIVGQVYAALDRRPLAEERLHLVLMGMGEPLLNLAAVHDALIVLSATVSWRRITVSTAGVVPGILEMARWQERPNLAVSLHAPDDRRRSDLMPINRKYPLAALLDAMRAYPATRRRPLFIEYTLIAGWNDRVADAGALEALLRDLPVKVNLIPLNPDPVLGADLQPPSEGVVSRFRQELVRRGMRASVRRPRGDDVSAACGQLRGRPLSTARSDESGTAAPDHR